MSHNNNIINKPINVRSDIAYVLGENTGDVGTLCKSDAIKFWSLRKPIRNAKIGELTDAEWAAANYGYTITGYNQIVGEGQQGLLYGHLHNESWLYLKPRGYKYNGVIVNEWFRVLDFNGYNHNSQNPFELDYNSTPEIGASSTSRINMTFLYEFLRWGLFSSFAPTFTSLYLGLLAWPASSTNPQGCYFLPITSSLSGLTIDDIAGNERFSYPVPSSVFSSGTAYILQPIIMTYDAGANYGSWVYVNAQTVMSGTFWDILCPEIRVTPQTQVTPDSRVDIYVDRESAQYTDNYPSMTINSVPFYISNGNGQALTDCSLYVYFKDYTYSSQGQDVELGHTSGFTVAASASDVLKTISGNITIQNLSVMAQGRYEFYLKIGTTQYSKTGTFSIGEK